MVSSSTPTTIRIDVPPNCELLDADLLGHADRHDRDDGQEERARQRDPAEHAVDVVGGGGARLHARNERALLLQVLRQVHRVEDDRRVEVAEDHDHEREQQVVRPAARGQEAGVIDVQRLVAGELRHRAGTMMTVWAKMIGITPAVISRIGMKVFCPSRMRPRPITLRGIWIGMRRAAIVIATTAAIIADQHDAEQHDAAERHDAVPDVADRRWMSAGQMPLEDRDGDQQAHAVADAALGDLLAQPHDEDGADGQRRSP